MLNKVPMTVQGAQQLRKELDQLKTVARPQIIEAIAEARAHGDLRENAEYHEARRSQSFIEGRIQDIEGKLSNVQVIDVSKMENTGKVIFGTTVSLLPLDVENAEDVTYHIVGVDEADVKMNKISVSSPIARALIGKEEGDEVTVVTPSGTVRYEITAVQYI